MEGREDGASAHIAADPSRARGAALCRIARFDEEVEGGCNKGAHCKAGQRARGEQLQLAGEGHEARRGDCESIREAKANESRLPAESIAEWPTDERARYPKGEYERVADDNLLGA